MTNAQSLNISSAHDTARLRARDVLGFLAFSHGWTWFFWLIAGRLGESVWDAPGVYFFYVGGAGVFIGGVMMSYVVHGVDGLRDLARRIFDPRRIAGRWWAVILLLYPALALLAAAIATVAKIAPQPLNLTEAHRLLAHPTQLLVFVAFILIIGPLPEEIGWRGFLLDRLQVRWNALVSSLLLAVIWWTWHLPLQALPGYYEAFGSAAPNPLSFLYNLAPAAILYSWVYNNTNRSVLGVILFHFVQNLTGEFLGIAPEVRTLLLVLNVVAALAVTLLWGPTTLAKAS